MGSLLLAFTFLAALGSGLIAGFFLAFSASVMAALGRIPPASGISAMQSVNLAVASLMNWAEPAAFYLLVGSLLYLMGSILVTMICNVPLNDRLAAVKPESAEGKTLWTHYLSLWTAWNHVRTVASLATEACFIVATAQQWG